MHFLIIDVKGLKMLASVYTTVKVSSSSLLSPLLCFAAAAATAVCVCVCVKLMILGLDAYLNKTLLIITP